MQNNYNTDKKSSAELLAEFEQKYNYRGSKEVNLTEIHNSDTGMQEQVTEETTAQDSVSFGASGVGIILRIQLRKAYAKRYCRSRENNCVYIYLLCLLLILN